ncbi:MAG: prepilin-type N-terminal cleavage/methylation domain-containing protein [Candidatus Ozemobacteraceae bacterium]
MRNRKGFTLMELLLVVAVLAIVAAAAAPTFFGGAAEAMNEAKKSSFLSAYQNTISGANLYLSIEAAKGNAGTANLDEDTPITLKPGMSYEALLGNVDAANK